MSTLTVQGKIQVFLVPLLWKHRLCSSATIFITPVCSFSFNPFLSTSPKVLYGLQSLDSVAVTARVEVLLSFTLLQTPLAPTLLKMFWTVPRPPSTKLLFPDKRHLVPIPNSLPRPPTRLPSRRSRQIFSCNPPPTPGLD